MKKPAAPQATSTGEKTMRLDKWLKMARIYRSREEAARACDMGRIKVSGQTAKPSRDVKVGDQLVIKVQKHYRTVQIKAIPQRGLSAKDARLVYDEATPNLSPETVDLVRLLHRAERALPSPAKGRPTKRERRMLDRFRNR